MKFSKPIRDDDGSLCKRNENIRAILIGGIWHKVSGAEFYYLKEDLNNQPEEEFDVPFLAESTFFARLSDYVEDVFIEGRIEEIQAIQCNF